MPRPRNPIPTYRLHRQSGQAVVTITMPGGQRRDILLGPHNSPESKQEYERVISQIRTGWQPLSIADSYDISVNEILVRYWRHAEQYYRDADGVPTNEINNFKIPIRALRKIYGSSPAREFGPMALKVVQQALINQGITRSQINYHLGRIRRIFKWAVSEELIPVSVLDSLKTVTGLRAGRTAAKESAPILPVEMPHVEAVLQLANRHVCGLIRFQLLTGCRPGEACLVRQSEIDSSGPVWFFRPEQHKNRHHGKRRTIAIGPQCQELLRGYLTEDPEEFLFSPARAKEEMRLAKRAARKSKVQPSQVNRRKRNASRLPGQRYRPSSYHHAVEQLCKRAKIPHWHPNQIRHLVATEIRRKYGLEAAQVFLGHTRADVTQIYAERDTGLAKRIAEEIG